MSSKITRRSWFGIVGALALAIATPVLAQLDTGIIQGKVESANGEAMPGILIFISSDAMLETRNGVTDAEGNFAFYDLGAGEYELQTTVAGFVADVTTVTIANGEHAEITITLQPRPPAE